MNDIARNIKNARRKSGLTQEQAALNIGYSIHSIRRWEQGEVNMSLQTAIQLSRLYNVSLDEFALGNQ